MSLPNFYFFNKEYSKNFTSWEIFKRHLDSFTDYRINELIARSNKYTYIASDFSNDIYSTNKNTRDILYSYPGVFVEKYIIDVPIGKLLFENPTKYNYTTNR